MSLLSIGPVTFDPYDHGNPTYSWGGPSTSTGNCPFALGGLFTFEQVKRLRELAGRKTTTIDGIPGVLERIEFDGAKFGELSGWYVITSFQFDPAKSHTMSDYTAPFSLAATYLVNVG